MQEVAMELMTIHVDNVLALQLEAVIGEDDPDLTVCRLIELGLARTKWKKPRMVDMSPATNRSRLMRKVLAAGPDGATKSDLSRSVRIGRTAIDEALDAMEASGDLTKTVIGTRGRPRIVYRAKLAPVEMPTVGTAKSEVAAWAGERDG